MTFRQSQRLGRDMVDDFEYAELDEYPRFNSVTSVTLGELVQDGYIDWSDGTWEFPKYSDEQDAQLKQKIIEHYKYRDIALIPVMMWKDEFLRTMREIMPKYIYLYGLVDDSPNLLGASSEYYKSRNIYSDFPQTQLSGANSDYASTGVDMEFERIRQGDIMDIAERLKSYDDIDLMIIKELEPLFSCILTMNLNAF